MKEEEHWIVREEKRLRKEKENPVVNATPFKELTEAQDKAREEFLKRHRIEENKKSVALNPSIEQSALETVIQINKQLRGKHNEQLQEHIKESTQQPTEQSNEQLQVEYGKHEARASAEILTEGNFILAEYGKDRYIVENTISSHCAIFTRYKSAKSAIRLINTNKVPTTGGEDFLQCLGWLSNEPDYVKRIYRKKVTDYPGSRFNLSEFDTGYLPACIDCDKPNTGSYEPDTGHRDDLKHTGDRTPEL